MRGGMVVKVLWVLDKDVRYADRGIFNPLESECEIETVRSTLRMRKEEGRGTVGRFNIGTVGALSCCAYATDESEWFMALRTAPSRPPAKLPSHPQSSILLVQDRSPHN